MKLLVLSSILIFEALTLNARDISIGSVKQTCAIENPSSPLKGRYENFTFIDNCRTVLNGFKKQKLSSKEKIYLKKVSFQLNQISEFNNIRKKIQQCSIDSIDTLPTCNKEYKTSLDLLKASIDSKILDLPKVKFALDALDERYNYQVSAEEHQIAEEEGMLNIVIGAVAITFLGILIWHFFIRVRCPHCRSLNMTQLNKEETFKGYEKFSKSKNKDGSVKYTKESGLHTTRGNNEKVNKVISANYTYKCNACSKEFTKTKEERIKV